MVGPTYLTTTFKDRDQVKALGARWDPDRRRWFVPPGRDLIPFSTWMFDAGTTCAVAAGSTDLALSDPSPATAVTVAPKWIALSQLLAGVAQAVSQAYKQGVWTRVEVVKVDARRGHIYLELAERSSDENLVAQTRAVIWADTANRIVPEFEQATGAVLGAGIKLLVRAKPAAHPLYGISLMLDAIDPDYTLGDLEARKRDIRERLQREGLFDLNRNLAPPWDYHAVLVIAPANAAGLGDFQAEAQRLQRFGVCHFTYAFSRFQGDGAVDEIRQTLTHALQQWPEGERPDAVVILRGGGAVNDLAWLNDLELARCICRMPVPVHTGIGHERDRTVLDEVANIAFDTPSKVIAGIEQMIVRRTAEARARFEQITPSAGMNAATLRHTVQEADAAVRAGAIRCVAAARERSATRLLQVRMRSMQTVRRAAQGARDHVVAVRQHALMQVSTARLTAPARLEQVHAGAQQALQTARADTRARLDAVAERSVQGCRRSRDATRSGLQEVADQARRLVGEAAMRSVAWMREIGGQGPGKTLGRGFALVRTAEGATLTSAQQVQPGQGIEIQFRDGVLAARAIDNNEGDVT